MIPSSLTPIRPLWFVPATRRMKLRTLGTLALFVLLIFPFGCQKESESVVSIALHPANANSLYVAAIRSTLAAMGDVV